jgi:mutator protein MutT
MIKVSFPRQLPDTKRISKVVVLNDKGEILLLQRKEDQPFPKKWDLPGGHLVVGETWEDGAKRETKEETNLDLRTIEMILDKGKNKYFKSTDWGGEVFSSEDLPEHDDYRWAAPDNLDDLDVSKIYLRIIKSATD